MDLSTELRALQAMPPQSWEMSGEISKYEPTRIADLPRSVANLINDPRQYSLSDLLGNTASAGRTILTNLLGEHPGQIDVGLPQIAPFYRITSRGKGIFSGMAGEGSQLPYLGRILKQRLATLPGPTETILRPHGWQGRGPAFGPLNLTAELNSPTLAADRLHKLLVDNPNLRFLYKPLALEEAGYRYGNRLRGSETPGSRLERILEKLDKKYGEQFKLHKYDEDIMDEALYWDPWQLLVPENVLSRYLLK